MDYRSNAVAALRESEHQLGIIEQRGAESSEKDRSVALIEATQGLAWAILALGAETPPQR